MSLAPRARRIAQLCGLSLLSSVALADGSGTLSDTALTLSYTGSGPYFPANVSSDAEPVCEEGTPLCDVFTLTVNLSDAFRADPANLNAIVEIAVNCNGQSDFDMFVYDANGNSLGDSVSAGCPESVALMPESLANGTYKVHVIPYIAVPGDSFDLGVAVTGIEEKSGRNRYAGALSPLLLAPLAVFGLRRRRG